MRLLRWIHEDSLNSCRLIIPRGFGKPPERWRRTVQLACHDALSDAEAEDASPTLAQRRACTPRVTVYVALMSTGLVGDAAMHKSGLAMARRRRAERNERMATCGHIEG